MDQKYIVALELAGTQVRGIVATVGTHTNGTPTLPTVISIVAEDTSDCVQFGRVQNLVNAGKLTDCVIQRLQSDPALQGGRICGAFVALAGRSFGSEPATAEIVLPNETVITADTIRELCMQASDNASQGKMVERVMPRRFIVDSQVMPNPVGVLANRLRGDFTLVTSNPINRRNLDMVFSSPELSAITEKNYIITPLAVADMVLDEEEKQLGCVLVDFGYQTTTISIYKNRALQFLATLPMGSQSITRDISVGLNVTMEKAEHAKCAQGNAQPKNTRGTDETARMNGYVAARAYEIVANISNCLAFAKFKASDLPEGFVLTGRASRLKNFDSLLSAQTKMRVRHAQMPTGINYALSTNTIAPEDYMALVALVMRIARNPALRSCVAFGEPETEVVQVEEPALDTAPQPQAKEPERPVSAGSKPVDDEKWDADDPDTDTEEEVVVEEKPKPKKRSSWNLGALKEKVIKLVSADTMESDSDLGE